jgi:hypothetical protein
MFGSEKGAKRGRKWVNTSVNLASSLDLIPHCQGTNIQNNQLQLLDFDLLRFRSPCAILLLRTTYGHVSLKRTVPTCYRPRINRHTMSLPPVVVHIKRKATEDPVELLRKYRSATLASEHALTRFEGVHESNSKRQRTDYVFSRQETSASSNDPSISPATPQGVRRIKQLRRSASSQSLGTRPSEKISQPAPSSAQYLDGGARDTLPTTSSIDPNQIPLKIAQPRRFHISRPSTPSNALGPSPGGQIRKRKVEPTIFVERRTRPRSSEGKTAQEGQDGGTEASVSDQPQQQQARKQKKPGLAARSSTLPVKKASPSKPTHSQPTQNISLPSGLMMAWDVNSEQLAAEMQAYTLQEIGRNLAASEAETPIPVSESSHVHKSPPSKFKPKKPALRYSERHPEDKNPRSSRMETDDQFVDEDMDDDSDYVIDTYVRMPVELVEFEDQERNIGLLVLESQPDIDEFYREFSESEEEDDEEEEDENGRNSFSNM